MGRISRQVMFMDMARAASRRSTCFRLNVGALVVHENNPVAVGWNGHEPGAPHCAGNDCPGVVPGACGTRHAELNAMLKADQLLEVNHGRLVGPRPEVDLYVTHSPCRHCCDYILSSFCRVKNLFFEVPYRETSHLGMFQVGLLGETSSVYEVTPAGYIVEYFSRRVVELP